MLVITGHQPSPLNSVELYFGLICPRICYWTKQSQNGFVLARRHSSVHNVQMMSPAELRFAVVKLTVAKWSMRAGAFRSRWGTSSCAFHHPEVICLGIFFIFPWVLLPLGHNVIDPLRKDHCWFRHLCMLLRKHKTGRTAYRTGLGSSQKAHKAGKVLSSLAGKCEVVSSNEGPVSTK